MTDTKAKITMTTGEVILLITLLITLSINLMGLSYGIISKAQVTRDHKNCANASRDLGAHGETLITYRDQENCYATFDHGKTFEIIDILEDE